MTPTTVVLDASAFMRSVRRPEGSDEALAWVERIETGAVRALAPDLIYAEVCNALLGEMRRGAISPAPAAATLDVLAQLPIRSVGLSELAVPALVLADERGLSAYDACYVVLAEQADAALVTADVRLASETAAAVLLPG